MKKLITSVALTAVLAIGTIAGVLTLVNSPVSASNINSIQKTASAPQSAKATALAAKSTQTETAKAEEQANEANEQQDESVTLPAGGIDQATAEQKAQVSIPGGVVAASRLEDENGVIVYGVEIKTGNAVHDVKVDAMTGSILKADQDNDKEAIVQENVNDEQELTAEVEESNQNDVSEAQDTDDIQDETQDDTESGQVA